MATGKKTGGRQAGSKNKATKAREEVIAASGLTPLEFMLDTMRNEDQPVNVRLDAAKNAAQYVHPKLSSVVLKGDAANPLQNVSMTKDEFKATAMEVAAEV